MHNLVLPNKEEIMDTTIYCSKCGEPHSSRATVCSVCYTPIATPSRRSVAYPENFHHYYDVLTCPSPYCHAEVCFPSPLTILTYENPNSERAKENMAEVQNQAGIFCWNCKQYVLRPHAPNIFERNQFSTIFYSFMGGAFLMLLIFYSLLSQCFN